jgi:hypothetical protein
MTTDLEYLKFELPRLEDFVQQRHLCLELPIRQAAVNTILDDMQP